MTWKTRLVALFYFYKENKIPVTHPAVGTQPTRNVEASAPAPNGPGGSIPFTSRRIRRSVRKSAERNQAPYNLPVDSPSIVRPQRSFSSFLSEEYEAVIRKSDDFALLGRKSE
jgi:hypothetical protein